MLKKQLISKGLPRHFICAVLFFSTVFLPFPAMAYVLQGAHVLDLTAKALGKAKTLQAKQKITLYNLNTPDGPAEFNETVSFAFPHRFRSDLVTKTVTRIHITNGHSAISVINGKRAGFLEKQVEPYRRVLTYHSRTALLRSLTLMGIDVSVSSLGRFDNKLIHVLGARYPDTSVSQVWIDKDLFLPLKLILVKKNRAMDALDDRMEVVYENWHKIGKIQFPMHLVFYTNDMKTMEISVGDVIVDPGFPEHFLSLEHLAFEVEDAEDDTSPSNDKEALNEVKETIEAFKKLYE